MNVFKEIAKFAIKIYLSKKSESKIYTGCNVNLNTKLEGCNTLHKNVSFSNSTLGFGSYIGKDSYLINSKIGRYCSIAENVKIIFGQHPTRDFVSTHPAFFSTRKQAGFTYVDRTIFEESRFADDEKKHAVTIGNDVWIGADVRILEGTVIGDGVIIATGAIVQGILEPYTIYGGIPAKKIRKRFSDEEIDFLMELKWWEKEEEWIKRNIDQFIDIKKMKMNFTM